MSMETIDTCKKHEVRFYQEVCDVCTMRELLYAAIKELDYVQSVENCNSGLCASAMGREIIKRGMEALGVSDLAFDSLAQREAAAEHMKERNAKGWEP